MLESENLKFGKQFLISNRDVSSADVEGWPEISLTPSWMLRSHPVLPVTEANSGQWKIVVLGNVYDPAHKEHLNQDIIDSLVKTLGVEGESFENLERLMSSLAGRWVLVARCGDTIRLYHDACGLKPVFYTTALDQQSVIASQPALLENVGAASRDQHMTEVFEQGENSGCWPVHAIPYHNVEQLLPNHFLDLNSSSVQRYWPREAIKRRSLTEAASLMAELLSNTIEAMANRDKLAISVTGGIDSRMILACCPEAVRKETLFFTIKSARTPRFDVWIPKRVSRLIDINYYLILPVPTQELIPVLDQNTGGMFLDGSVAMTESLAATVAGRVHCPGLTAPIFRCHYYPDGVHPADLDAKKLAQIAGYKDNPVAISGISRWLESVPMNTEIPVLELFNWEYRVGVWAACGLSFREALMNQVPPMNSRRFFETGLSVCVEERRHPYNLARKIIECKMPVLNTLPHNPEPFGRLRAAGRAVPLPWRVKKFLRLT